MVQVMREYLRMGHHMVKEYSLYLMEVSRAS